jgi:hypothetical protein
VYEKSKESWDPSMVIREPEALNTEKGSDAFCLGACGAAHFSREPAPNEGRPAAFAFARLGVASRLASRF